MISSVKIVRKRFFIDLDNVVVWKRDAISEKTATPMSENSNDELKMTCIMLGII